MVTRAYVSHFLSRCLYVCGQGVGREMTDLCVCKYSPRGQTSRKKMVSFIFYILTICDHNFLIQRVLLNILEVINRLLTF